MFKNNKDKMRLVGQNTTILPKNHYKIIALPKEYTYQNKIYLNQKYKSNEVFLAKISSFFSKLTNYYPVDYSNDIPVGMVGISSLIRNKMQLGLNDDPNLQLLTKDDFHFKNGSQISLNIILFRSLTNENKISKDKIKKLIQSQLNQYPIYPGQLLAIQSDEIQFVVSVDEVDESIKKINNKKIIYFIHDETKLKINNMAKNLTLAKSQKERLQNSFNFDFASKGVGGLKQQLEKICHDILLPRVMPLKIAEKYGEQYHSKGILLYGPPGTGKTLVARTLANAFSDKVKIINGPELMNKYVGESQKQLREQFIDARLEWKEKKNYSDLHVIIIDEFDAIAKKRSNHTEGSDVKDDMVSTLLTELDGVDSPQNMFVICTTNRKDLIDPALLRFGRIDNLIKIDLPTEEERGEIFNIHLNKIEKSLLDDNIDVDYWIKSTVNYTGAEIERLINMARHNAMANNFVNNDKPHCLFIKEALNDGVCLQKITNDHFKNAFQEIYPAFGIDKNLCHFKKDDYIIYNNEVAAIINNFCELTTRDHINKITTLILGESGTGKTHLAIYLSKCTDAKYTKILKAKELMSLPIEKQIESIEEVLENLKRVNSSVIILDEIENLVGANAELTHYNNTLRLKIENLLKDIQEEKNNIIVIATASNASFLKQIKLYHLFNEVKHLSKITLDHSSTSDNIIRLFSEAKGYKVRMHENYPIKPEKINLALRDFLYQLDTFLVKEDKNILIDINDFYQFLLKKNSSKYFYQHILNNSQAFSSSFFQQQQKNETALKWRNNIFLN